MSYLNISKEIEQYLKKIKFSETKVKDILKDHQFNSSSTVKNREIPSKVNGLEFKFIKEYIKRKIKKNRSLDRLKSNDFSTRKNKSFEKISLKEKKIQSENNHSEYENKSIQVDFLRPIFRFEEKTSEESEKEEKISKKKFFPRVKSLTPSNNKLRDHSKPKNPSKFMNDYYKFHVKLNFPPKTSSKSKNLSLESKSSSKKFLQDLKRIKLFNISE